MGCGRSGSVPAGAVGDQLGAVCAQQSADDLSEGVELLVRALCEATDREVAIIDELARMELASQPVRDAAAALLVRPCGSSRPRRTDRHRFTLPPSSARPTSTLSACPQRSPDVLS